MRKIFYGESLCIVLTFLFYIVPSIGTIKNNFNAIYLDVFAPRDTAKKYKTENFDTKENSR